MFSQTVPKIEAKLFLIFFFFLEERKKDFTVFVNFILFNFLYFIVNFVVFKNSTGKQSLSIFSSMQYFLFNFFIFSWFVFFSIKEVTFFSIL